MHPHTYNKSDHDATRLLFRGIARAESYGPDTWAVTGVAMRDVLNIRERDDANSMKLGEIPADGTGLINQGCNEKNLSAGLT